MTGLFSLNQDIPAFKEHLRDFLVQIKVSPLEMNYRALGGGSLLQLKLFRHRYSLVAPH